MSYEIFLFLHVVGATVLLGTGTGIAFFMVVSSHSRDARLVAHVAGIVVLADFLFTATVIILQPITGLLLAREVGWPILEGWIAAALVLYCVVCVFWVPVVWMQIRMRDLAASASERDLPLPTEYFRLYRLWCLSGFPAFGAVLAIIWLMLTKPDI